MIEPQSTCLIDSTPNLTVWTIHQHRLIYAVEGCRNNIIHVIYDCNILDLSQLVKRNFLYIYICIYTHTTFFLFYSEYSTELVSVNLEWYHYNVSPWDFKQISYVLSTIYSELFNVFFMFFVFPSYSLTSPFLCEIMVKISFWDIKQHLPLSSRYRAANGWHPRVRTPGHHNWYCQWWSYYRPWQGRWCPSFQWKPECELWPLHLHLLPHVPGMPWWCHLGHVAEIGGAHIQCDPRYWRPLLPYNGLLYVQGAYWRVEN